MPIYICSKDNFANAPSRKLYLYGEQMLQTMHFSEKHYQHYNLPQKLTYLHPGLINRQINMFQFKPDAEAFEVDAFFMLLTNLKFYAFPPFSCISQCLQ